MLRSFPDEKSTTWGIYRDCFGAGASLSNSNLYLWPYTDAHPDEVELQPKSMRKSAKEPKIRDCVGYLRLAMVKNSRTTSLEQTVIEEPAKIIDWLVVWIFFIFHILGIMIPIDFHIFQGGRSTTNQEYLSLWSSHANKHIPMVCLKMWSSRYPEYKYFFVGDEPLIFDPVIPVQFLLYFGGSSRHLCCLLPRWSYPKC